MNILVVGSGGREHALCWKMSDSPLLDKLYCAPGNAGIAEIATCLPIAAEDIEGIVAAVLEHEIDFVVIGPEAPLVAGLADRLRALDVLVFGPSARAAILEGSKGFTKDLCAKYNIPTAAYGRFTDAESAKAFIRSKGAPIVVKADGLAAGKGVVVAESESEAIEAVERMMSNREFGAAGAELVIEEFLEGEEASFFAIVDGVTALPMTAAQDHKRVGDGDTGPNTGGMGAYSPAPIVTPQMERRIMEEIILPTVRGMAEEGRPFSGVLFAGLMITKDGPKLIEYNTRFGDPECQCLMMRLQGDVVALLLAAASGTLEDVSIEWRKETALLVVMAAKGYPGAYEKGSVIKNLDGVKAVESAIAFHAGTQSDEAGRIVATGGRVLGIAALDADVRQAQERAYQAVDVIDWPQGFCRRDIGWRAV